MYRMNLGKMAVSSECWLKLRIVYAVVGIFIGLSVFFAFGLHYENWNCAIWGLISGKSTFI